VHATHAVPLLHRALEHLDLPVGVAAEHLLHLLLLGQLEHGVLLDDLVREGRRSLVSGGHRVLELGVSAPPGLGLQLLSGH
jgi:hypothetical protein